MIISLIANRYAAGAAAVAMFATPSMIEAARLLSEVAEALAKLPGIAS